MTKYKTMYARTDENGDMVMPIQTVNKASFKESGKRCLVDGKVDEEYFAKKQFGTGYMEVSFEEKVPLYIFKKSITGGKAVKDKTKEDKENKRKDDKRKMYIEMDWIETIRSNLNVKDQANWKDAELKVGFNQWPNSVEFLEYDPAYKHN